MEERSAAAVPAELEPGQVVGDYEVLTSAGDGGMGVVYKARQRSLGRIAALKVIRPEVASEPEYRKRFLREARLAASVDHPHVISVYYVGDEGGRLFLASQWIDGEDLKRTIDGYVRLPADRAVRIATQLGGALDAVHSVGLVHRDVKPANVLLRRVGEGDHAYLTDFGIATPSESTDHLTQTGWTVGTAGYLSPEQIRGLEPGPRSDLYALACVFFEMLTGRAPFVAENEMALCWAHANDPRPTASEVVPTLGRRYDRFFEVALAIEPEQRFASGREFADALAAAHSGIDTTASKSPDPGPAASAAASSAQTALRPPDQPGVAAPNTPPPSRPSLPPSPPVAYPAYGYITPLPPASQPSRSITALPVIVLVIAMAGIAAGALAAAGVFSHNVSRTKTSGTTAGAVRKAHASGALLAPASAGSPHSSATAGSAAAGTTSCGGDLSVGPNTSCGFAANVEQAYGQTSGGDQTVTAYSPATGETYTIACSGGSPHVCSGGTTHDASVYFTSGPGVGAPASTASGGAPSPSAASGASSACDSGISVGSVTTCPFADNVFAAYVADYRANGEQSNVVVTAYSPVTHLTYHMDCANDGTTVTCTGGKNSLVTFPIRVVQDY
jgi:serine/threonine protein kinase